MKNKKCIAFLTAMLLLPMTGCNIRLPDLNLPGADSTAQESQSSVQETKPAEEPETTEPEDTIDSIEDYAGMTAEEITATLSLEEKADQMLIAAIYYVDDRYMKNDNYGSILSLPSHYTPTAEQWTGLIAGYQEYALKADSPIPFLYGQDSVHGVNYARDAVIFPHNINIGAANDPELTYEMGLAVADEMKLSRMIWNYAPCVAVSGDPRWGRTYESYSSDPSLVRTLGDAFTRGQLDGGVIVCAKHYIGDGSVSFGTGEVSEGFDRLIDRGNAELEQSEIDAQLEIYKQLIENGAQTIMISHSALNGVKMHENTEYVTDVLRGELGFEGVIVSDWNSIQNIEGGADYKEKIILAVNAGIDWLMEPHDFADTTKYLVEAVEEGSISQERMDEAVTRIIQLKLDAGLFEDPYLEHLTTEQSTVGSDTYRALARQLAAESQVLLKNENNLLPLKSGTKVFVTGPAADDTGVQCGGWTMEWLGSVDAENDGEKSVSDATTILEALEASAGAYGLEIITDEARAAEADVTLLCVGERPYAEWHGDTESLSITGAETALEGNAESIALAKSLGKPTVTLLVAGRNMIIEEYKADWDSIVMSGLPGSEGQGVVDVLVGEKPFTGKLAMPWYASEADIEAGKPLYEVGYGLTADGGSTESTDTEEPDVQVQPYFYVENGLFRMDSSLMGKTYEELNGLFGGAIPPLTDFPYWGPKLDYADAIVDGMKVALFFQNDRLVMAAYDQRKDFDLDVVSAAIGQYGTSTMIHETHYSFDTPDGGTFEVYENFYSDDQQYYLAQRYASAEMQW